MNTELNSGLKRLFELAHAQDITVLADWIPRTYNTLCDDLSKFQFYLK